jgi:hypothetical protein
LFISLEGGVELGGLNSDGKGSKFLLESPKDEDVSLSSPLLLCEVDCPNRTLIGRVVLSAVFTLIPHSYTESVGVVEDSRKIMCF